MTPRRTVLVAAVLAPWLITAPAAAYEQDVIPQIDDASLRDSVSDLDPNVEDLGRNVDDVAGTGTDGGETVVTLAADVLFAFGKATMPPSAPARIAALMAKVPRRATLKVHGHTDSVGSTTDNLALSKARAQAVAAAVRAARPDLRLDVRGFGETRPVAPNSTGGADDPVGRAKNRRVELRY